MMVACFSALALGMHSEQQVLFLHEPLGECAAEATLGDTSHTDYCLLLHLVLLVTVSLVSHILQLLRLRKQWL